MEKVLLKLAQQLNQYDEASLMALWENYAALVENFEPSERWEEAALILCMIQGVHWKNQLFNTKLAASARRGSSNEEDKNLRAGLASIAPRLPKTKNSAALPENTSKKSVGTGAKKNCKVLVFRPRDRGKP